MHVDIPTQYVGCKTLDSNNGEASDSEVNETAPAEAPAVSKPKLLPWEHIYNAKHA